MKKKPVNKERTNSIKKKKTNDNYCEDSHAFYEQLMRHDWHRKTGRRLRQRGWGK